MSPEPRITDHDPVIEAARADASREGARMLTRPLVHLWRFIRRAPRSSPAVDGQRLAAALHID